MKHNKRKNVGIMYELLVRNLSNSLIEGDNAANKTLRIIKKYYSSNSELFKEFRIFNALLKTTVNESIALSIISEAKNALSKYDNNDKNKLENEKLLLIKEIDQNFNQSFYDTPIPLNYYQICATIQTLFNEWRNNNSDIVTIIKHEQKLLEWLTKDKIEINNDIESIKENLSPGESRLLMKSLSNKLNEKYGKSFNDNEKAIIKLYFNNNETLLKETFLTIKQNLLERLHDYVLNKISEVKKMISEDDLSIIDDNTVIKFLMFAKLTEFCSLDS